MEVEGLLEPAAETGGYANGNVQAGGLAGALVGAFAAMIADWSDEPRLYQWFSPTYQHQTHRNIVVLDHMPPRRVGEALDRQWGEVMSFAPQLSVD